MNTANLIVDLVLFCILALCAFLGYKKGALATLISLVGGIAALFVALLLASPISALLAESWVEPALTAPIRDTITSFAAENGGLNALLENPPAALGAVFETYGLDTQSMLASSADAIAAAIAKPAAAMVCYAAVFLVLLVVLLIAVRILISLAKKFNRIPLLGGANKLLGLAIGLLQGLIFACCAVSIFHMLLPYISLGDGSLFSSFAADGTFLYRPLSQINLIQLVSEYLMGANK